jgi:[protein-PII] uridylyltransferase
LAALAGAIFRLGHVVHSAHIATYGERAVDVFYLTRSDGKKLGPGEIEPLRAALLHAAAIGPDARAA